MPDVYVLFTTILSILLLILIVTVLAIIIYPKKPIEYIKKSLHITSNDEDIYDDCTSYESFTNNHTTCNIFYLEKDNSTGTIIVDLPGGAFIASSNTLKQYLHIDQPHTVVSLEYPVLPDGKYENTLTYLKAAISYILSKYGNPQIIISAASAGCFYATKIINSEEFKENIIKFISSSGYFGYKTIPNIATIITDKVYLRTLKASVLLDCFPISPNIQTFFAIGEYDPLKDSTIKFLSQSGAENEIVEYPYSDHCFYLKYNNPTTQEFYKDVSEFIKI
ncbi:esterase [Homarus gammarus nudivirus]|uniref:Esterase n=1 Tax=Homarus gammarus nudivirus TaxID=2509616 RepID=A0A411HBC0_9VIRU|nr:esterase [Homarus gammarus nudivirus]QBB28692.1 esterase [Homarus gammarus nudivirus]